MSSNSTVAKVDNGKITAAGEGSATIYAIYSGKFLTCEVTVKAAPVTTAISSASTSTTTTTASSPITSAATSITAASTAGMTTVTTAASTSPSADDPYIVFERMTMTVGDTKTTAQSMQLTQIRRF